MKKETLITVISTFLLTTLFWLFMFLIVIPPSKGKSSKTDAVEAAAPVQNEEPAPEAPRYEAKAKRTVDYTESIVGHWEPVEVSSFKLDFSQYGTPSKPPQTRTAIPSARNISTSCLATAWAIR